MFVTKCCAPKHRGLFESWSINTRFSWKREYFLRFLEAFLPRLDALIENFDMQVLRPSGELGDGGPTSLSAQVAACSRALQWPPLKSVCLVLQAIAVQLQRFTGFLEGADATSTISHKSLARLGAPRRPGMPGRPKIVAGRGADWSSW